MLAPNGGAILLVAETYGEFEEAWEAPLVGPSGIELFEELADAGFITSEDASTINRALYAARNAATRRLGGRLEPIPLGECSPHQRAAVLGAIRQRDATLSRYNISLTNVVNARPPNNKVERWFFGKAEGRKHGIPPIHDRYPHDILRQGLATLERLIGTTRPRLIICLGGTSLWALSGKDGITKWRGSQLSYVHPNGHHCALLPTLHPAAVLREYTWRPAVVTDLRRALHHATNYSSNFDPGWNFLIRPTLSEALDYLADLLHPSLRDDPLVSDTETSSSHITCIGFGTGPRSAGCIPFLNPEEPDGNYWRSPDDELLVIKACRDVLTKRRICFHNGLYDNQVIQEDWGFWPNWTDDTMIAQHVAFPGFLGAGIDPITGATSKKGSSLALSFLASMYCSHYVFWKDDGRFWDPSIQSPDAYWRYNCEDCARTEEVRAKLEHILSSSHLQDAYAHQCTRLGPATLRIMRRGIALNRALRTQQLASVRQQLRDLEAWLERILGHPLNPQSAPQMQRLFYNDFALPHQYKGIGEAKRVSCDDEALSRLAHLRPELLPLIRGIQDYRTLAVLGGKASGARKSLLICDLDPDDRLRFSLNLCGAETFRYSGGPTARGTGCNPQNILKD